MPTYAFTDYSAQAQTIKYCVVDIGKPPYGQLTPFNAYTAQRRCLAVKEGTTFAFGAMSRGWTTRRRRTGMLSTSDKVKVVDVVDDAARWHGTVDTKSVDAVDVVEDAVGTEQ